MIAKNLVAKWTALAPRLQSVMRIVAGLMFMEAGTMKLFAFPIGMPPDGSTAKLLSQVGLGGILEVFGGALLLLGLFTRPVAFLLARWRWRIFSSTHHRASGPSSMVAPPLRSTASCGCISPRPARGRGVWMPDERSDYKK